MSDQQRRQNWETSAYNPELGLLYIPSIEGCNYLELMVQEDMADQGGPVQPREWRSTILIPPISPSVFEAVQRKLADQHNGYRATPRASEAQG